MERPGPGDHRLELVCGGGKRTYGLHAPPGYERGKPRPLVMVLHFSPGTGAEMRELTGFDVVADRAGSLVAYPDGVGGAFNALVCCGAQDDVGFLRTLAGHLVTAWNAAPDRIFLAGISNGGDMSFRPAVEAPGVFAAIGVASGGFIGAQAAEPGYAPTEPVSVVTIIGATDSYADQFTQAIAAWRQRLRCCTVRSGQSRRYREERCIFGC